MSRPLTAPLGSGSRVAFGVAPAQSCPGVGAVALRAGRQGDHRLDAELVVAVGVAEVPELTSLPTGIVDAISDPPFVWLNGVPPTGAIARKRVGLLGAGIDRPWLTRS